MFVMFIKNARLTEILEMVQLKEIVLSTSSVSRMEHALLVGFEYLQKYFQERLIRVSKDLHIYRYLCILDVGVAACGHCYVALKEDSPSTGPCIPVTCDGCNKDHCINQERTRFCSAKEYYEQFEQCFVKKGK